MPPMALITVVGIIIWVQRTRNKALVEDHNNSITVKQLTVGNNY